MTYLAFSNSLVLDPEPASFLNRRSRHPFEYSEGTSKVLLNSEEAATNLGVRQKPDIGMNMNQFVSSLFSHPKNEQN